ncbi:hypothetical protein OESDEN_19687, partial [Oesophagostomum dentatum]
LSHLLCSAQILEEPAAQLKAINQAEFTERRNKSINQMFNRHKMEASSLFGAQRDMWLYEARRRGIDVSPDWVKKCVPIVKMAVDVAPVPYATIILHCLKYPHSGVYGILLGTKTGSKVKVTSVVPLSHESSPLAPSLEVALAVIHASYPNIVGVYFSNENYKDR